MSKISIKTYPLVILAVFAASLFVLNFTIGAIFTIATGTPGASGLVTGITTGLIMSIALNFIPRWWSGVCLFGIYCLLAIPTVLMGPPGPYKVVVGLLAGFAYSIIARADTKLSRYIAWIVFTLVLLVGIYGFFELLDLPGKERFKQAVLIFFGIFTFLGFLGTWLGDRVFNKYLKDTDSYSRVRKEISNC